MEYEGGANGMCRFFGRASKHGCGTKNRVVLQLVEIGTSSRIASQLLAHTVVLGKQGLDR